MKTVRVRLPETLAAGIEAEARERRCSNSDVIRERLERAGKASRLSSFALTAMADLIGSIEDLPSDLSARKKHYLKSRGYGQKRSR